MGPVTVLDGMLVYVQDDGAVMAVALDAGKEQFDSYDDTIAGRKMLWRA